MSISSCGDFGITSRRDRLYPSGDSSVLVDLRGKEASEGVEARSVACAFRQLRLWCQHGGRESKYYGHSQHQVCKKFQIIMRQECGFINGTMHQVVRRGHYGEYG